MSSWPPRCPAEPNGPTRRVGAPRRVEVGDDVRLLDQEICGRSAQHRGTVWAENAADGEPNISTAVCVRGPVGPLLEQARQRDSRIGEFVGVDREW